MFQDLMQFDTIKAISLWQPWASLAALGAKKNETRSWSTSYRGLLLIHAAKRFTEEEIDVCWGEPFRSVLKGLGFTSLRELPLGHLLGVVTLQNVIRTDSIFHHTISEQEWVFGDYSHGRFAWQLANPRPFPKPIEYRGRQGLFDVPVSDIWPYLPAETIS